MRRANVASVPRRPPLVRILAFVALVNVASCSGGTSHDAPAEPAVARRDTVETTDAVRARVGEQVSFDVVVDPRTVPAASNVPGRGPGLAGAFRVGARVVVWIAADGDTATQATSAHFGVAEVREATADRLAFTVTGTVPAELWSRRAGGATGTRVTTAPGRFTVVLDGFFRRALVVQGAGGPVGTAPAATLAAATPADQRVLGERDLAGVAFGTDEATALARLRARFGPPSFDELHPSRCGEERLAGWGDLLVVLRATSAGGPKVFVGYHYSAPHAGTTEGPRGLATASGLEPGMSLAELRAAEPRATFVTDPDSLVLASWNAAPGARLAGRLSDDVTAGEVAVVELASSLSTLPTPTLQDEC